MLRGYFVDIAGKKNLIF